MSSSCDRCWASECLRRSSRRNSANLPGAGPARFDLNVLDLGEAREEALLVAVAGSERGPGTQFGLRVAEIGWAYFEERPSEPRAAARLDGGAAPD